VLVAVVGLCSVTAMSVVGLETLHWFDAEMCL
jgi:hypothetical protein